MPARDDRDEPGGVVAAVHRASVAEIRRDLVRLEREVAKLDAKLDDQKAELVERQVRVEVELRHMTSSMQLNAAAELEIRKADALAKIAERSAELKSRRAIRKELVAKGMAIAIGLWGLISAMLSSRC